jgi:hypothetical protein
VSFRKPDVLRRLFDYAEGVDELRLGPDGQTLYFTTGRVVAPVYPKSLEASQRGLQQMQAWNNGKDNVWKIDLAPWLRCHARPACRASLDRPRG